MKRSVKTISAVVAIVAFVAMSFAAAKAVTLHLKLQKGEKYTVTVKSNQTIVMNVQGQSMTQGIATEQQGSLTVTDDNTVASKWESVLAKISTMGMELVYDSKHPENTNPMLKGQVKQFEDILKAEAVYKFDEQGAQISKNEEDMPVGPAQSLIREWPKAELTKGYEWEKDETRDAQGTSVKMHFTYTVRDITKKNVVIDYVGTGKAEEMNLSFSGTFTCDLEKGIVVKDVAKSDITASVTEQGMVIPIKISGTSETIVK